MFIALVIMHIIIIKTNVRSYIHDKYVCTCTLSSINTIFYIVNMLEKLTTVLANDKVFIALSMGGSDKTTVFSMTITVL